MIEIKNVTKVYYPKKCNKKVAIDNISFSLPNNGLIFLLGKSGSGKSTLLNLIGTLDKPTSGSILFNGENISDFSEKKLTNYRSSHVGFVFQEFNLLDTFSIEDNIYLPLVLSGVRYPEMRQRLEPIASQLGISNILEKFPYEVSGGQKQRVAVARALIINPQLILADEPTGALDSRSANELLKVFGEMNQAGQTILMVTHSARAASTANRVMFMKDGVIYHQIYRGNMSEEEMYEKISASLTAIITGGGNHA